VQTFKALTEKLAPPEPGSAPDPAPQGRQAPRRRRHLALVPKLRDVDIDERCGAGALILA
jgi:hypothetical protein